MQCCEDAAEATRHNSSVLRGVTESEQSQMDRVVALRDALRDHCDQWSTALTTTQGALHAVHRGTVCAALPASDVWVHSGVSPPKSRAAEGSQGDVEALRPQDQRMQVLAATSLPSRSFEILVERTAQMVAATAEATRQVNVSVPDVPVVTQRLVGLCTQVGDVPPLDMSWEQPRAKVDAARSSFHDMHQRMEGLLEAGEVAAIDETLNGSVSLSKEWMSVIQAQIRMGDALMHQVSALKRGDDVRGQCHDTLNAARNHQQTIVQGLQVDLSALQTALIAADDAHRAAERLWHDRRRQLESDVESNENRQAAVWQTLTSSLEELQQLTHKHEDIVVTTALAAQKEAHRVGLHKQLVELLMVTEETLAHQVDRHRNAIGLIDRCDVQVDDVCTLLNQAVTQALTGITSELSNSHQSHLEAYRAHHIACVTSLHRHQQALEELRVFAQGSTRRQWVSEQRRAQHDQRVADLQTMTEEAANTFLVSGVALERLGVNFLHPLQEAQMDAALNHRLAVWNAVSSDQQLRVRREEAKVVKWPAPPPADARSPAPSDRRPRPVPPAGSSPTAGQGAPRRKGVAPDGPGAGPWGAVVPATPTLPQINPTMAYAVRCPAGWTSFEPNLCVLGAGNKPKTLLQSMKDDPSQT